jgi:hypothetical protein
MKAQTTNNSETNIKTITSTSSEALTAVKMSGFVFRVVTPSGLSANINPENVDNMFLRNVFIHLQANMALLHRGINIEINVHVGLLGCNAVWTCRQKQTFQMAEDGGGMFLQNVGICSLP